MIRFTGYEVIGEKLRVRQSFSHFVGVFICVQDNLQSCGMVWI